MLTFDLYREHEDHPRVVHLDPCQVASVVETERRPAYGGWQPVAVVALRDGTRFTVLDSARRVARQIAEAQKAARPSPPPGDPQTWLDLLEGKEEGGAHDRG